MTRSNLTYLLVLGACCALPGCALFTKHKPQPLRYFSPQIGMSAQDSPPAAGAAPDTLLRLGRVDAASHLRESMVYRDEAHELHFYENRRWTDRPEALLQQALARCLFEERGLTRVVSGNAATLDVHLNAFDEITDKPHRVMIDATIMLYDAGLVRLHETLRIEEPVSGTHDRHGPDAVVDAFSRALRRLVEATADRAVATLAMLSSAP